MPHTDKVSLGIVLNGHTKKSIQDGRVPRGQYFEDINDMWEPSVDFVLANDFGLAKNFYRKWEQYLVTIKSENIKSHMTSL